MKTKYINLGAESAAKEIEQFIIDYSPARTKLLAKIKEIIWEAQLNNYEVKEPLL